MRLPVLFSYTGHTIFAGIAGVSEKFSVGVSGLVKKKLDCTVRMPFTYTLPKDRNRKYLGKILITAEIPHHYAYLL